MTYAVISTRLHALISQTAHLRHVAIFQRSANSANAFRAASDKNCRLEQKRGRLSRSDPYDQSRRHNREAARSAKCLFIRHIRKMLGRRCRGRLGSRDWLFGRRRRLTNQRFRLAAE